MKTHPFIVLLAVGLTFGLVGCSTTSDPTPDSPLPTISVTAPTGHKGAVDFDNGFIQLGSGSKHVDLYLDLMCPYCKEFEKLNGEMLFRDAEANRVTLRIHPIAILNRLSLGSNYSTRAAASLVDVAAHHPHRTGDYIRSLYNHQPAENTGGPTDAKLSSLARSATGASASSGTAMASYAAWVNSSTARSSHGPLDSTDEIPFVQQVPTVIVDRNVFRGESVEGGKFKAFYAAAR